MDVQSNSNRIVKNTAMLYFRLLLTMAVGLYTSRVVLNALGAEDFGIYNVVGGVVAMLSFFNSSMATATQRFLNYEMGMGNIGNLPKVFSMSFITYCIIAVAVMLLSETVGLWFVVNKLVIPPDRVDAAFWVYQLSIMTFIVNMLSVPYNAVIIAHEKMSAFAYISIFEALGKLLLAYLITVSPVDRLVFYAILMFAMSLIIRGIYGIYCRRHFEESKLRLLWDVSLLKRLFSFSGWMLSGTVANLLSTQGVNMLINIFFGPLYNAARAVAMQVFNAVNSFVANFMTAVRPQIVKSYAQQNFSYMYRIVFSASKLSFFLLFVLSLPIIFETEQILTLWLKNVPASSVMFTRLVLVDLLVISSYSPIAYVSQASGKIRDYQIIISVGFVLIFIFTWLLFSLGFAAYTAFIVMIIMDVLGLFARLLELRHSVQFRMWEYLKKVSVPIIITFSLSLCLSLLVKKFMISDDSITYLLFRIVLYWILSFAVIYIIGMDSVEKKYLNGLMAKVIRR